MKKLLLVAVLAIVGVLTGCKDAQFAYLTTIQVSPGTPSVAAGLTQQFTAQGTFSNGATRDITSLVTWSSSTPSVASIATGGLATALAEGSSTISASFTQPSAVVTGSTTLTVTAPTVTSIMVSPTNPSVGVGATEQFSAQGTFANGTTSDITSQVTWSSSTPSVASIAASGLATTLAQGSSTISASLTQPSGTVTGSTTLTVTAPTVTSILVSPAAPSVEAGLTQQFTAQGKFTDGTTSDITSQVTWNSSAIYVSSIASGGLATSHSKGQSTITASLTQPGGAVTGTAALTVTAPGLVSIVIADSSTLVPGPNSLANAEIAAGTSKIIFAYGIYTDGGERNITGSVKWTSGNATVATINTTGLVKGLIPGTASITATDPTTSLAQSVALTVNNATVTAIAVSPNAPPAIPPLTQARFTALGEFSDGTTQDITRDVNWSSTNTAVATIIRNENNYSTATGVAAGTTTIQAALGGTTGSASLTVNSLSLVSIAITPSTSGIAIGSTRLLNAVGTFSDGSQRTIIWEVTWSVTPSDGSIAQVSYVGAVTGVAAGTATVTAQLGSVTSNTATVNVQSLGAITTSRIATQGGPTADSITVTPTSATIASGTATRLLAIATLADGTTQDVTNSVTWISTTPTIAIVSDTPVQTQGSAGWVSGITAGNDTIAGIFKGQYDPVPLTVTNATLTGIAITPAVPLTIPLGNLKPYMATATFSDSTTQDLTTQVTWTSSDPKVAVINSQGVATSTGKGSTMIKATANINGITASDDKALTVVP